MSHTLLQWVWCLAKISLFNLPYYPYPSHYKITQKSVSKHLVSPTRQLLQKQFFSRKTKPLFLTKTGHVLIPAGGMGQVRGRGLLQGLPYHQIHLGGAVVQHVAPLFQVAIQGTNLCRGGEEPQGAQPRLPTKSRNPISKSAELVSLP